MDTLLFIILVIILAVLILIFLMLRKVVLRPANQMVGKRDIIEEQKRKNNNNLNAIMVLFGKYEELTNMIIREELGFNDRSIVNYMDQLEKSGRVRQVGKTGLHAHYIKVN